MTTPSTSWNRAPSSHHLRVRYRGDNPALFLKLGWARWRMENKQVWWVCAFDRVEGEHELRPAQLEFLD